MTIKPHTAIGVLDRMIKQLTETFAAFQEDKHPDISATTYAKICTDMNLQLETLQFARGVCAKGYGDPANTPIEGTRLPDAPRG